MEEASAANRQRLESAEAELNKLKRFLLSSASLELAAASTINVAAVKKQKASRRATCDPSAFNSTSSELGLFRSFGGVSALASSAAASSSSYSGYPRPSMMEMSMLMEEQGDENELSASEAASSVFGRESLGGNSLFSSASTTALMTPSRPSQAALFGTQTRGADFRVSLF